MTIAIPTKESVYEFYGDSLSDTGKIVIDTMLEVAGTVETDDFGEYLLKVAKVFELLSERISNESEFMSFMITSISKIPEIVKGNPFKY